MTPEQRRQYGVIYPRLMELSEKHERNEISVEEFRELERLEDEMEALMNQISPYPPTNDQN